MSLHTGDDELRYRLPVIAEETGRRCVATSTLSPFPVPLVLLGTVGLPTIPTPPRKEKGRGTKVCFEWEGRDGQPPEGGAGQVSTGHASQCRAFPSGVPVSCAWPLHGNG
eukprot:Sspe_Gene.57777::Locus_31704_Transcript_2_2_Confidence_0.800_Length_1930::g.57777::m.57777